MLSDVRYGARVLRRNPGFTLASALCLAVAIGANTAVFSLLDQLVLRKLPVERPDELVWLRAPAFSYPVFEQVRERGRMFAGLFGWDTTQLRAGWSGQAEPVETLLVTDGFYSTLGVRAIAGRTLTAADARSPVAVISYGCWQRRFAGDPAVGGKTIRVERVPFTIVGVTPPEFFGIAAGKAPELTIPVGMLPLIRPDEKDRLEQAARAWLHIMGRIRPELSVEQADAAFQTIWPTALQAAASGMPPGPARDRFLTRKTGLVAGGTGFSPVRNEFTRPLLLLMGTVGLVLVTACANLAGLMLARSSGRRKEIAVAIALGAGRGRIIRQLFIESLLLAVVGAALGVVAAAWAASSARPCSRAGISPGGTGRERPPWSSSTRRWRAGCSPAAARSGAGSVWAAT